jgi:general stress protein 26
LLDASGGKPPIRVFAKGRRIMIESKGHEDAIKRLGQLIGDIRFAMLTTVEPDGTLRSRPMATHQDHGKEFDGVLWFFTKAESGKIDEVEQDQHVNLSYASPEKSKYVSVSGIATIVRDKVKAEELWDPKYKAWFPDGLENPNLALLRVDATKAEYWETPGGAVVYAIGLVKALATGQSYQPGDHEKVDL